MRSDRLAEQGNFKKNFRDPADWRNRASQPGRIDA